LFRVKSDKALLSQPKSYTYQTIPDVKTWYGPSSICWGPGERHVCFFAKPALHIWKFDAQNNSLALLQSLRVSADIDQMEVALTSRYVAASCESRRIHVWDRESGQKLHTLCDAEDHMLFDAEDVNHTLYRRRKQLQNPLMMIPFGHLLFSISYCSLYICVWNIKTGTLLKKHFDEIFDPSDMLYVRPLNAIVILSGFYSRILSFHTSDTVSDDILSIRRLAQATYRSVMREDDSESSNSYNSSKNNYF
jgi:hypothetical protein